MTARGQQKHRPWQIPTVQPSLIYSDGTDCSSAVSSVLALFRTVDNTDAAPCMQLICQELYTSGWQN